MQPPSGFPLNGKGFPTVFKPVSSTILFLLVSAWEPFFSFGILHLPETLKLPGKGVWFLNGKASSQGYNAMNEFDTKIGGHVVADGIDVLQVNVGLKCNQACTHCHLRSSPARNETMSWETMERVLDLADQARDRKSVV